MPPKLCEACRVSRALIVRPKNGQRLCKVCFIDIFETEVHETITQNELFKPGERVAIGASGGKDSTVLASVLKTLNERHGYGLHLILLSIDEGITGYRDDSLETVKRNAAEYDMPLTIVGYDELYGWTMDQVVEQIGKKGNCTYCGVFRRQALDRGAARLDIQHVVTGHNADDMAETVMMNLLRADLPRLARATSIITASAASDIKRSKPLKYAYEKEIVLYAHHRALDYFTTECIYSPEAFRGSARTLIKNLERTRPQSILDIVRSGEDMAKQVPASVVSSTTNKASEAVIPLEVDDEGSGGCGSSNGERITKQVHFPGQQGGTGDHTDQETEITLSSLNIETKAKPSMPTKTPKKLPKQALRRCERCGYLSSQALCKACVLLEGLNKARAKTTVSVDRG